MTNRKLLWLDLNSSYSHSSMALPALHAQLHGDAGWEWVSVPTTINEAPDGVLAKVVAESPSVIAATCWLFTHEQLIAILARCAAVMPDVTIILGGPEFLGDNEAFLRRNPFVKCVFRGEGEVCFPLWLERWDSPALWSEIPGCCWLDADGLYHDNGLAKTGDRADRTEDRFDTTGGRVDRTTGEHFDTMTGGRADRTTGDITFQDLELPERSRFFNWDKSFVQLETTRGCFNTCAFCVSGGEKPVRVLPMDQVRARVAEIHAHGIKDVRMLDRTFNYDNKRAIEMLDLFCEYHPDMHFHLEVHPALLTPELKAKLATLPAGLLHIEAGIQSLHADVLKKSGRKGSLEASLAGLEYLASLPNLVVHADLIAGLPLYTLDQIFSDVLRLAQIGAGEIQLESLKVLPGTRMRRQAAEMVLCFSPLPPYEVLATDDITPDGLRRAMQLSRMIDFYYNSDAWQKVFRRILVGDTPGVTGVAGMTGVTGVTGVADMVGVVSGSDVTSDTGNSGVAGMTGVTSVTGVVSGSDDTGITGDTGDTGVAGMTGGAGVEFMNRFLDHLIKLSVIDSPLSQERRGIILYEFCQQHYPQYLTIITMAWAEAGMSLKKSPAEKIFRVKRLARFIEDSHLVGRITFESGVSEIIDKDTQIDMSAKYRLYYMPLTDPTGIPTDPTGILYGFDADQHQPQPVLKCYLQ